MEHPLVLHPSYWIDIHSLIHVFHAEKVIFESHDSYLKQTYRNRCKIIAANGTLQLNIPIVHQHNRNSPAYKSIKIDYSQDWQSLHLKSIKSAYSSSPFYDYYEDDLQALYQEKPVHLFDWNLRTFEWMNQRLHLAPSYSFTDSYLGDARAKTLITAKGATKKETAPYIQVFQEKFGFVSGLSSLDILFNLGPSTRVFLKDHKTLVI
jgi:hypothetical protein